jgi:hypothetical protein
MLAHNAALKTLVLQRNKLRSAGVTSLRYVKEPYITHKEPYISPKRDVLVRLLRSGMRNEPCAS